MSYAEGMQYGDIEFPVPVTPNADQIPKTTEVLKKF